MSRPSFPDRLMTHTKPKLTAPDPDQPNLGVPSLT